MSQDALIVGLNAYQHLPDLRAPAQDANAIATILADHGRFRVRRLPEIIKADGSPRVSRKGALTFKELKAALVNLFKPSGDTCPDTAIFFFSGHGVRDDEGVSEGFLATSDANPSIGFYGLSLQWLRQLLQESPVPQQLVWLDCCYAGAFLDFKENLREAAPRNKSQRDRSFIAACREYEVAHEQTVGQHSVLTGALINGLDPSQRPDGWVTNLTLTDYIKQTLSSEIQCPVVQNSGRAIVLATRRDQRPMLASQGDCPYKALVHFEEADAEFFFGRTALTDELIQRVKEDSFTAVIGPSGSGKSSVLRAGLLHQLKLGLALVDSHAWRYLPIVTPDEHPIQRLEQAIGGPFEALSQLISAMPAQRVVLVIDQFEECFTLCKDAEERQRFISGLFGALEHVGYKLCLIVGMRADFLGCCIEYPQLAVHLDRAIMVKPMERLELEEAIVEPARKRGVQVEPQVVSAMVEDVTASPGRLPLLQFCLTALWNTRKPPRQNWLTLEAYRSLGGIKGTLEQHADRAFEALSPEEQNLAKRIFIELTQLGDVENTRRRVKKQDLLTHPDIEPLLDRVIDKLVASRLIVVDGGVIEDHPAKAEVAAETAAKSVAGKQPAAPVVLDIAHESLIRHWQKLRDWLQAYQDWLPTQRELQANAQSWCDGGRKPERLLHGGEIDAADTFIRTKGELIAPSLLVQSYIKASAIKRRRTRQFFGSTAAAAITGAIAATAVMALLSFRAASEGIESLAVSSVNFLQGGNQLTALLRAVEAGHQLQKIPLTSDEARIKTLTALQQSIYGVQELNRFQGHSDYVMGIDVSADGSAIVSGSRDGTVRLWQRDGTERWSQSHTGGITAVSISGDGALVASADAIGMVSLWQADSGELAETLTHPDGAGITAVQFGPDDQTLAIADEMGVLRLWHLKQNRWTVMQDSHSDRITQIQINHGEGWLASASEDGTVMIWDLASGERLGTFDHHTAPVTSLSLSADGKTLVSGDQAGHMHLWQWDGRIRLNEDAWFNPQEGAVTGLHFSPNGEQIAASSRSGIQLFQAQDGVLLDTYTGHNTIVRDIAFHPQEDRLISAGDDGIIRLWQLSRSWHKRPVYDVSVSPDGRWYASASGDETVKIWDGSDHTPYHVLTDHQDTVLAVSFSPDGTLLASASADQTLKLWEVASGRLVKTLTGHEGDIYDVAFSADGSLIASAGSDGSIRVWDGKTHQLIHTLEDHTDGVTSLSFHRSRPQLASGSWDGTVKLWNLSDGSLLETREIDGTAIRSVAFSADGSWLAAASSEGPIRLWRESNPEPQDIAVNLGDASEIVFHPDGRTLISAGATRIAFWSLDDDSFGTMIRELSGHSRAITSLAMDASGTLMVSGSDDQSVIPWLFELEQLMATGCDRLADYLKTNPRAGSSAAKLCL